MMMMMTSKNTMKTTIATDTKQTLSQLGVGRLWPLGSAAKPDRKTAKTTTTTTTKMLPPIISCSLMIIIIFFSANNHQLVSGQFAVSGAGVQMSGGGGLATMVRPSQASGKTIGALSMASLGAMAAGGSGASSSGVQLKATSSIRAGSVSGLSASNSAATSNSDNNWAHQSHMEQLYEQVSASSAVNGMAPPECYSHLMQRYNKWFKKYKAMQQSMGGDMSGHQSAEDVVKDVFSRIGQSLVEQECGDDGSGSGADDFDPDTPNSDPQSTPNGEMVDFIYKALNNGINQLDNIIDWYGKAKGIVDDVFLAQDDSPPQDERERVARLLERAKQKAINMAKDWATLQVKGMVQQKGLETVSSFMTKNLKFSGDPLSYLEPMVQASQSNTLELVVDKLTDMHFRGAIMLINRQKPMDFLRCRKNKNKEPYC